MPIATQRRPHRRVQQGGQDQHHLVRREGEAEVRPDPEQDVAHHETLGAEPIGQHTHHRDEDQHADRLRRDHHAAQPVRSAELQLHVDRQVGEPDRVAAHGQRAQSQERHQRQQAGAGLRAITVRRAWSQPRRLGAGHLLSDHRHQLQHGADSGRDQRDPQSGDTAEHAADDGSGHEPGTEPEPHGGHHPVVGTGRHLGQLVAYGGEDQRARRPGEAEDGQVDQERHPDLGGERQQHPAEQADDRADPVQEEPVGEPVRPPADREAQDRGRQVGEEEQPGDRQRSVQILHQEQGQLRHRHRDAEAGEEQAGRRTTVHRGAQHGPERRSGPVHDGRLRHAPTLAVSGRPRWTRSHPVGRRFPPRSAHHRAPSPGPPG